MENPGTCTGATLAGCRAATLTCRHCSLLLCCLPTVARPFAAAGNPATAEGSAPLLVVEGDIVTLNWKCFNEEGEVGAAAACCRRLLPPPAPCLPPAAAAAACSLAPPLLAAWELRTPALRCGAQPLPGGLAVCCACWAPR